MNSFDQIQTEVFSTARATVSTAIDLTNASTSYSLYTSQAAVLDEGELSIDDLQNSWSVNSAVGNSMQYNCGFLLNTPKNYVKFEMTAVIVNNDPTVDFSLTTAYQCFYTIGLTNYYFSPLLSAPVNIPHAGGTVSVTLIYIGLTFSNLPTIPASTVLTNGSLHDLTVTTSSIFSPELEDDEAYRIQLQTVYIAKGSGTLGRLRYGISQIPYVSYSEVYLGTNPTGTTTIEGKNDNYVLNYGDILAIINSPYINNVSVQQAIGLVIENQKDIKNITYVGSPAYANQITTTVTLDNGQTTSITFYTEIQNEINILLTVVSQYALFNDTDIVNLSALLNTYCQSQGIGGSISFSEICIIVSNYYGGSLNIATMSVTQVGGGTTDNVLEYTQKADQQFFLNLLQIGYTV